MPLVERSTYKKPLDEPFREWDLERCVYCRSSMALEDAQCTKCGHQRSQEDIRMAVQVCQYRWSVRGQQQYQLIHDHEQSQHNFARWTGIAGAFLSIWPMAWILGTVAFGDGSTFAWIASLLAAMGVFLLTDPDR